MQSCTLERHCKFVHSHRWPQGRSNPKKPVIGPTMSSGAKPSRFRLPAEYERLKFTKFFHLGKRSQKLRYARALQPGTTLTKQNRFLMITSKSVHRRIQARIITTSSSSITKRACKVRWWAMKGSLEGSLAGAEGLKFSVKKHSRLGLGNFSCVWGDVFGVALITSYLLRNLGCAPGPLLAFLRIL